MTRHVKRTRRWSKNEIAASPSEFRRSLSTTSQDSTRLAKHAGKRLAHQLEGSRLPWHQWRIKDLHPLQIEQWRRRFGVPKNRANVMLMVAWSELRKFHMRHSLFVPKRKSEEPRISRKAAWRKAEKKKGKPRRESLVTCIHDVPYYRVCAQCKRNKLEARAKLERMISQYLSPKDAKKFGRLLATGQINADFWITLRRKFGIVVKQKAYQPATVTYRRFMRQRQRELQREPVLSAKPIAAMPLPQRLVAHEMAYAPTLCVAIKTFSHTIEQRTNFRCNRPVSRGVFCDECSPKQ
jgi:hypothetical protein